MNVPAFPTDNLYKFLALSGLVTLAFTAVFPFFVLRQISVELIAVQSEIRATKLETDHLGNLLELAKDTPEFLSEPVEIFERSFQLRLKTQELERMNEELRFRNKEIPNYRILLVVLFLGSFLATAIGFRLWYIKLQRFQDRAIAYQGQHRVKKDDAT